MSEVPLISTEKQAELLQSSDISKYFVKGQQKSVAQLMNRSTDFPKSQFIDFYVSVLFLLIFFYRQP